MGITDGTGQGIGTIGGASDADQVAYDNTTSGLTATDVQDAIDEVSAGSGGAFDYDIAGAGLVLDLNSRISSSIIFAGSKVQSWTDQKNGFVFEQNTDANRPIIEYTGLRFSGSQWLQISAAEAALNITGPMTIMTVARVADVTSPANATIFNHSTGTNGYKFGYGSGPAGEARFSVPAKHDQSSNIQAWFDGQLAIIGTRFASGSNEYEKNGAALGGSFAAPGNPVSVSIASRVGANNSGGDAWDGAIERILIYNTKLTGDNLTSLRDALSAEYKL